MLKWFSKDVSKVKKWFHEMPCPYGLCPSNQPFDGAHKPKLKFIQSVSPQCYQYRCEYCHNLVNIDGNILDNNEYTHMKNPALMGGKPSYRFLK